MLKPTNEDLYFQTLRKMQKQQKTLFMTLKKQWFDLILSGEKKEEYREIKEYWIDRLTYNKESGWMVKPNKLFYIPPGWTKTMFEIWKKDFDIIRFKNGYGPNDPVMDVECLGIEIREGRPEWGAVPGTKYFVLKLGNILKRPG